MTRFSSVLAIASLLVSAASLAACGGPAPAAAPPSPTEQADAGAPTSTAVTADAGAAAPTTTAPSTTSTAPAAEGSHWDSLPKDKKVEIMATKVVPNVGKVFKEFDGKKYEKFGCVNCHGPQKKDDPHNVLPKLTFSNGGYEKMAKAKPEVMKLMAEKVLPTMAAALGEKPFDPATKQGFGCGGCHTVN